MLLGTLVLISERLQFFYMPTCVDGLFSWLLALVPKLEIRNNEYIKRYHLVKSQERKKMTLVQALTGTIPFYSLLRPVVSQFFAPLP